ncbi:hypothetical protein K458DRAFT_50605 [Lentithecium fluviatile CBS 122367]|uniref:Rhodopsin domain-containing protein n=1 Tax=Lentithecium fluviatile CBS 122367 TaxID=1168545 RepID=A0A6G1IYY4_9PLEO|nr:hypothetical protein K458DRAFT_50605 [Lentithecium fluviatile CBS 122367]
MQFRVESWIWYTFAVGIIIARLISRSLLFGSPKGLQYDDWIMGLFVTACYTVLIVMSNIETEAQSNLLPPGFNINNLATKEVQDREYGSKIVIVVEQMQIAVIWACKACLLILYHRLTRMVASKENVAIKLLAAYVALGFVVMEVLYFAAWCRPFSQYWAVPTKSSQCNALINHRITNAVFNISSDLVMLCIALPMFIRSLLPLKRKLILCCIFSLGIFVILASVLNKYYGFSSPYEPTWIAWYIRESSTAILVANLPFTWTLLRRIFNLGAFDEAHPPPPTYHSSRTAGGRRTARAHVQHSGSAGSAEKHPHNSSHSNSSAGKESRSMSLIGTICTPKEEKQDHLHNHSQHSENGLLKESIQSHDFGANVNIQINDVADMDLDMERALSPTSHSLAPRPVSPPSHSRPTSPTPSHNRRVPRLSVDGTGGFYINNHPTSPHCAHLNHPHAHPQSRSSSIASANRRPLSPAPSMRSHGAASVTSPAPVAAGGGRSARDRKMRARMST